MAFNYNLVTDSTGLPQPGVMDGQSAVANLTISLSTPTLVTSSTAIWSATPNAEVGKIIQIYTCISNATPGAAGDSLVTTITASTSTTVTLANPATAALPRADLGNPPTQVYWGTDNILVFADFNTKAQAWLATHPGDLCTLTIPAGICGSDTGSHLEPVRNWTRYIPNLQVVGVSNPTLFGSIDPAVLGLNINLDISGRIANSKIGDTTLQLLNPSNDAWKFTAGRTASQSDGAVYTFGNQIMVCGLDTQGFGEPPNFAYWEYAKISSINTTTGLITLTAPLSIDGPYLSTYPNWVGPYLTKVTGTSSGTGGCVRLQVVSTAGMPAGANAAYLSVRNVTGTVGPDCNGYEDYGTVVDSTHIDLPSAPLGGGHTWGGNTNAWGEGGNVSEGRFIGDLAGPASIYAMDSAWNCSITFNGLTISGEQQGAGLPGQFFNWINCTFVGPWSPNPSVNDIVIFDGCTVPFSEMDKEINEVRIINGTHFHQIKFQSMSVRLGTFTNSTIDIFQGTPKNTVMNNCTGHDLTIGIEAYGLTSSFFAANSILGDTGGLAAIGATTSLGDLTLVNGVIESASLITWAVPGARIIFSNASHAPSWQRAFNVLGVTQPGGQQTPINVATDLVGSSFPTISGGIVSMGAHACPNTTFINCTGCPQVLDLSNIGAQGKPIFSYSKRTYFKTADFIVSGSPITNINNSQWIFGNIVFVKVTINTPYNGSHSPAVLVPFAQFANYPIMKNDYSTVSYPIEIDLTVPGLRTITPSGVSGVMDSYSSTLPLPDPVMNWMTTQIDAALGPGSDYSDGTNEWSFTIEIQTDQGFPSLVTNFLRTRYRVGPLH